MASSVLGTAVIGRCVPAAQASLRLSLAIWWFFALVLALIWERIIKTEPPMSYGRITDGNYMPWDEFVAETENAYRLRLRERESWKNWSRLS